MRGGERTTTTFPSPPGIPWPSKTADLRFCKYPFDVKHLNYEVIKDTKA
jgi:hypothetical protein